MRVFIADSNSAFRSALTSLLRQEGYEVAGEAADGRSLASQLAKVCPDIVCLDHELANCEYSALMASVHQDEGLRGMSVVLMTAADAEDVRTEAARAGAAGFLHKPFSQGQVVAELRQVAHARRLLRGLAGRAAQPAAAARCRVVVADDSETQRKLLRAILEDARCAVVGEADNGAAAVELVREHAPDLICLDVEMPVMNGLDALSQIHAAMPQLPVMMITSHAERALVKDAAARGARGYIVKPYRPEKIREALDKLLGSAAH